MILLATLALAAAQPLPTPIAARELTIGALDKVSGEAKTFTLKPGQVVSFGRIRIGAATCQAAPPWERPHTGAFVQIDGAEKGRRPGRLFSGWLFAESPSLNSFDHPRYDVWVKSCAMRFPETGPKTLVVGKTSSAPKSAPVSPVSPTAPESN